MSSEFEDKLTIANGFPIVDQDKEPGSDQSDFKATVALWREWGLEKAVGRATEFNHLFDTNLLGGGHPQVAAEEALDWMGIEYEVDIFL